MSRDQAGYFDQSAPYLTEKADRRIRRIREFLAAALADRARAGAPSVTAALDVGCGPGTILETLPAGVQKVGLDISPTLLERARAKGIETHNVDLDAAPLPFPDGRFDLVIATDVIEHVLHTDHLLNEINRVLRPGGLFVAGIPNINQPVSFVMQFVLDLTPMFAARYRCPHYRDFTARLFRLVLEKHGFAIGRREGSYLYPFEGSAVSVWLAKRLPRWGAQVFFAAEKKQTVRIEEGFEPNMPALLKWLAPS